MERRDFVKSALATVRIPAMPALAAQPDTKTPTDPPHEFYQLRTYTLRTGPQTALTQRYFETALIPALNRLEMSPIGAFKLDVKSADHPPQPQTETQDPLTRPL